MRFPYRKVVILVLLALLTVVSSFSYSTTNYNTIISNTRRSKASSFTFTQRNMFTGIVEDMGTIIAFEERNDIPLWDGSIPNDDNTTTTTTTTTVMTIQTSDIILSDTKTAYLGCSICVSGVCLTATHIDFIQHQFTVTLAPETLRKTYFGQITKNNPSSTLIGSFVNLERAAEMNASRNSGHYVQGHVDDVGVIVDRQNDQDSIVYTIQVPKTTDLMSYIVPKGFIAIDGTSLTVVDTDPIQNTFRIMLIPYTQQHIILPLKHVGDYVNLEVDILAKYAITNSNNNNNNKSDELVLQMQERIDALEQRIKALETALSKQVS